jgi:hypothetical protein
MDLAGLLVGGQANYKKFWYVISCGSWKNRRFGGTYRPIIRVKGISEIGTHLAVVAVSC